MQEVFAANEVPFDRFAFDGLPEFLIALGDADRLADLGLIACPQAAPTIQQVIVPHLLAKPV